MKLANVYYHGSDISFSKFEVESVRADFGSGYYFGGLTTGQQYTNLGNIYKVCLNFRNPIITMGSYDLAEYKYDFDSPSASLIESIYGEQAFEVIKRSAWSDGKYGIEVKEKIIELGFDGILIKWHDCTDDWAVAFNSDQITLLDC